MDATTGAAVADLLARHDGLARVDQLEALGVSRKMVRTRIARGDWVRLSDSVVVARSTPRTWHRDVRAAWLDAGADTAVSHSTGGRLHAFDGFERTEDIHLTVCGDRHRTSLPGVHVHRSILLTTDACTFVGGIRVVSKPVALMQIAVESGRDAAARALDSMLRDGVPAGWLEQVASEWQRRGGKGSSAVLELLHERVDQRLPRSWFQRVAKRLLATRGIELVDEHPVRDPATGRLLAELDLANPELMIGVECQSWSWHGSPAAQARDALRKRRLRLLGWEIVDVWWSDLRRIDGVVSEVQYVIDQRSPRVPA